MESISNVKLVKKYRSEICKQVLEMKRALKKVRLENNLTLQQVATTSGLSVTTVWRAENCKDKGKSTFTLNTALNLESALDRLIG